MTSLNMFNFLTEGAPSKPADLELLKEFSKQAASAFLSKESVPLNFTIQKIASAENLSPGHIDIICQDTNRMVQAEMFKTAEDHYTDFELADPSVIVSNLDKSIQKTASLNTGSDFDFAPSEVIKTKAETDFSVTKTAGHAGLFDSKKLSERKALEKTAAEFQANSDSLIIVKAEIESLENKFVKIARQQIMIEPLKDRADGFKTVHLFCKHAGLKDPYTDKVMGLLEHVLKGQGILEKTAEIKVDEKYISENLNARVVNGTHPLYIVLKTLVDKNVRREAYEDRANLIKTRLDDYRANGSVLGQTVTEL